VVPYPPKAGFLLRAYHLLNGVARHHTVDLVAFVQEPWLRTIYGDVEAGLDDCRRALSAFCNELHFLPIRSAAGDFGRVATAARALLSGRSYTTSWLQQSDAAGLIAEASQRNRYDLVHFDTIGLAPYRDSVGRRVTTLGHHNIESHLFARRSRTEANVFKRRYYSREGRLLAKYERTMAARFNAHITCSDLDSARLAEVAGPVPAHAIPNGVDCDYFRPSESQHENADTLLFVGTLNWHPNVDAMRFFLTEVWPKLRAVDWPSVSAWSLGLTIYSALFALCVAYTIWYVAVRRIGSARTSAYSNLIPVVAMVTAVLFLGEPIELRKAIGAAAVLAGVAVTRTGSKVDMPPEE